MHKLLVPLLLILLAGCVPSLPNPLALDPATAQTAIEDQLRIGAAPAPIMNVTVRRVENVPDGAVALFTYETENEDGVLVKGTGVHDLRREGLDWISTGGGTSMPSDAGPLPALGYMGTGNGGDNPYSTTAGSVSDPAVTQVAITFTDGAHQVVPVVNETYFVVRQGADAIADDIQGLDEHGAVLHTVP